MTIITVSLDPILSALGLHHTRWQLFSESDIVRQVINSRLIDSLKHSAMMTITASLYLILSAVCLYPRQLLSDIRNELSAKSSLSSLCS